jgi:hypothetical protein
VDGIPHHRVVLASGSRGRSIPVIRVTSTTIICHEIRRMIDIAGCGVSYRTVLWGQSINRINEQWDDNLRGMGSVSY